MIALTLNRRLQAAAICLPGSKSESNRALILQALAARAGIHIELQGLSEARDTTGLMRLLAHQDELVADVSESGTSMRFLAAYYAATGQSKILTGGPRMCQRPISPLVEALRALGAHISYRRQEGFPPLEINSNRAGLQYHPLHVDASMSSQFITALLLVAPFIPGGLTLSLTGPVSSAAYIRMTLSMLKYFGIESSWDHDTIRVNEQLPSAKSYQIEPDWSAAGYWYSLVALSESADILLKGLRPLSWQGDARIAEIMAPLGVRTTFTDEGAHIQKIAVIFPEHLDLDCNEIPDQVMTLAVTAAALGIPATFRGLHNLRIKESDRIAALQEELGKFGISFQEGDSASTFELRGTFKNSTAAVSTHNDHRIAMAFSAFALLQPNLQIEAPEVVEKSYPGFWKDLADAGALINTFAES